MRRFQLVRWFPHWHGFAFRSLKHSKSDLRFIYDWCLYLGFWEVRKWHELRPGELDA